MFDEDISGEQDDRHWRRRPGRHSLRRIQQTRLRVSHQKGCDRHRRERRDRARYRRSGCVLSRAMRTVKGCSTSSCRIRRRRHGRRREDNESDGALPDRRKGPVQRSGAGRQERDPVCRMREFRRSAGRPARATIVIFRASDGTSSRPCRSPVGRTAGVQPRYHGSVQHPRQRHVDGREGNEPDNVRSRTESADDERPRTMPSTAGRIIFFTMSDERDAPPPPPEAAAGRGRHCTRFLHDQMIRR